MSTPPMLRQLRHDVWATGKLLERCRALTEDQLAALIDALSNVERLVLVGDPRHVLGEKPRHVQVAMPGEEVGVLRRKP